MDTDPALASVIASGCVAIAATLAPIYMPYISELRKWTRERKASEARQLEQATTNLFEAITPYMTGHLDDAEIAAGHNWARLYADLRSAYYVWERALWPHCGEGEQRELASLRAKIDKVDPLETPKSASAWAHDVLGLPHKVGERIA